VYRAIHESGLVLAIKVVNMARSQHEQIRSEVDLLKRCSDNNIVRLYGTIQKDEHLWVRERIVVCCVFLALTIACFSLDSHGLLRLRLGARPHEDLAEAHADRGGDWRVPRLDSQ